uniref:C-type lectin domain-containing protein n=1 Tax=Oryzias melastigma TaxID=30732 RepID=A0A3B3DGP5_ORYME
SCFFGLHTCHCTKVESVHPSIFLRFIRDRTGFFFIDKIVLYSCAETLLCLVVELMSLIVSTDHYLKQNWIYFSGSFYYISTTEKSWQSSRDDCLGRGADLIIIDSREENEFARKFQKRLWIGLSDRQNERFAFVIALKLSKYNTNVFLKTKLLYINDVNSWNDLVCTNENFWICEKKTEPNPATSG